MASKALAHANTEGWKFWESLLAGWKERAKKPCGDPSDLIIWDEQRGLLGYARLQCPLEVEWALGSQEPHDPWTKGVWLKPQKRSFPPPSQLPAGPLTIHAWPPPSPHALLNKDRDSS